MKGTEGWTKGGKRGEKEKGRCLREGITERMEELMG